MSEDSPHRAVRSFVKRGGRTTRAQQRALGQLLAKYGVADAPRPLDARSIFGREAPLVLEIGFGNGETLAALAARYADKVYLGIEVHEPGIGHLLLQLQRERIGNVRVLPGDAVEILRDDIADQALDEVLILFPDPWPKKRHHKRRIVQRSFLDLCADRLEPGGSLHIATDWANYAEHIDQMLAACDRFTGSERREHDGDAPLDRPVTKFERRGLGKGHRIHDWRCEKTRQSVLPLEETKQ